MVELLEAAFAVTMASNLRSRKRLHCVSSCHCPTLSTTHHLPLRLSMPSSRSPKAKSWKLLKRRLTASCSDKVGVSDKALLPPTSPTEVFSRASNDNFSSKMSRKKRVFLLDVNPLCYKGSTPSLQSFAHWITLFFSQVSLTDPVIAVLDGERGNEYRRQLLPSYKANRRKLLQQFSALKRFPKSEVRRSQNLVIEVLQRCNVPVVKIEGYEADDVVATLVQQVLQMGYRVAIASPDKDFKQLISEDVQIVIPVQEFDRWTFYTLKHYVAQYNCDPLSDLSLNKRSPLVYDPI